MGYCSHYELDIKNAEENVIEILREENDNARFALDDYGDTKESCKWYDHKKELKEFSKKYPEAVFELKREGEESGDISICYFKNGKVQECEAKITFDAFDEAKLK